MNTTGIVFDRRFENHNAGHGHPERPERIATLAETIAAASDAVRIEPRAATESDLELVHTTEYIDHMMALRGVSGALDPDTHISADSYDTALLAAGGLMGLVDEVMAGRVRNGFAFVRPPGHHAEAGRAMGFCLFNNIAVAAAHLRRAHGLERILIIDWDVHHGNGTQHMFESDPNVLYLSTHQYPYYPGTGAMDEVGRGAGEGFTVNLPFPPGYGDAEYVDAFCNVIQPIAEQYGPQFVLVSAGFDPHRRDPLAGMNVTESGFAKLGRIVLDIAAASSSGRCVALLEGGYDLTALRTSSSAVLSQMTGSAEAAEPNMDGTRAGALLSAIRRTQSPYWKF